MAVGASDPWQAVSSCFAHFAATQNNQEETP